MAMAVAGACTLGAANGVTRVAAAAAAAAPSAFLSSEVHSSGCSGVFSEGRRQLRMVARPAAAAAERRKVGGVAVRGLFGLGVPELAVIAGVAALVFGPKQLPAIGKSLGKTVKSFQTAAKEFESEISKAKEPEGGEKSAIEEEEGVITSTPIATPKSSSENDASKSS